MSEPAPSRVRYLDFARGVAVFLMILQHSILVLSKNAETGNSVLGQSFLLLGTAPAAPVFLLVMGIFIGKSRSAAKNIFRRGLRLFLCGYALNLLRFVLPAEFFCHILAACSPDISRFWVVDIFQVAGLSMMVLALCKKIPVLNGWLIASVPVVLLISPGLWGITQGHLTQPLWGTDPHTVYFPFFPWVIYPIIGVSLSDTLISINVHRTRCLLSVLGVALILLGLGSYNMFPAGDLYSRTGAAIHFAIIGFTFLWLPFCSWLHTFIQKDRWFTPIVESWSHNVTAIYCVQWILFGWCTLILGANQLTDIGALAAGLMILLFSHVLCRTAFIRGAFSWI